MVKTINDIFAENRPKLNLSSIKTYVSHIRTLNNLLQINITKPRDIISNSTEIMKYLNTLEPKLRKARLACLIVFLDTPKKNKEFSRLSSDLRAQMLLDIESYQKEIDSQILSPTQQINWIEWSKVMEMYDELKKHADRLFLKSSLDRSDFKALSTFVLLSCMVLIEPRRSSDWTHFKIRNIDTSSDNFMREVDGSFELVFNKYKTSATYNQQIIPIPNTLAHVINSWSRINKSDYLLLNLNRTGPMQSQQVTTLLNDFFVKKFSTSMLRHSYLSYVYKDVPQIIEIQERASNMGHSVKTAMEYVKKYEFVDSNDKEL